MIKRLLSLCALYIALTAAPAVSADAGLAEKARIILDYQSHMRGDTDSGVRFFIARAGEFTGTPLAALAMRLALAQDPAGFSAVDVGETEARRLLAPEAGTAPEVLDLARRFVARSMMFSRRRDEAMAIHRQRGLAMAWRVAGPFETLAVFRPGDGRGIMAGAGEPDERDVFLSLPDADRFAAWRRNPPWRRVPDSQAFPFVYPWRWVAGEKTGAVALRTGLVLEHSDSRAEFHIFSDVSWTLYVDGVMVAAADRNNAESPLEHSVELALPAGNHEVAVLLPPPPQGPEPLDPRFALRLATASPFSWSGDAVPGPHQAAITAREARPPRYLLDLAAKVGEAPALRAVYAAACAEQGMFDEGAWQIAAAATADPDNLNMQILAGILVSYNRLLPLDRRRDLAATWHRKALATRPDLIPSLLFLADLASSAGRAEEAREYIARAYAAKPTSLLVLMARGEWSRRHANAETARDAWREVGAAYPNSLAAQRAIASMPVDRYMDMDRRIEACRAAVKAGDQRPDSLMLLAEALADSGNVQESAAAIREAMGGFPGDARVLAWAADIHSRLGQHDEAAAALSEAIRLTPWRADFWRRLGDVARERGKEDEALNYWRVSLAADPGQHELDDMVRFLSGAREAAYYDGGYDAVAMVAGAEAGRYAGDVVRLLDRSVVSMERDGSFRRLTHEIDLVQTRRGGELLADIDVPGELLTARTIFPNGDTFEPEAIPGRAGLRLPALMPGAARELQYIEFFPAKGSRPPRQSPWFFQHPGGTIPFLVSEYEVRVPKGFPLVHVLRDHGMKVEFETAGDESHDIYRWTARFGLSAREPDSVHVSERLASVETGVRVGWNEVVYHELAGLSGRLVPSRAMTSILASLLRVEGGGRLGPEDSARAIYRFVCDNVESDPTASGAAASHILANRMGDRNLLLLAMLRAAGFNAYPAAARPNQSLYHPPDWDLPRRDIFTIPLVRLALPGGPQLWLDTRFATLPFGKMADDLSEATLIAFTQDGPLFETLPRLAASESERVEERRLLLPGKGGDLEVVGRSSLKGVMGLKRREFMVGADPDSRRREILRSLFPVFPDANLRRFDIQRPAGDEAFSLERYEITSGTAVEKRNDGTLAIALCLAAPDVVSPESLGMRERTTACHIRMNHVVEDRNTFVLPKGGRFVRIPESRHIPGDFGIYQLRVIRRLPDQLDVVRRLTMSAQRIKPWEWKDFLRFLADVDLAERQWVEYVVD